MIKNTFSRSFFWVLLFITVNLFSCCSKQTEKIYYDNGNIKKLSEKACGKFEGISKSYYRNGQLSSVGKFKDDNFDGKWISYYPSGELKSKHVYRDGSVVNINIWNVDGRHMVVNGNGEALILYPDGSRASEQIYINNKLNGESKTWYDNGNLESVTPYIYGEPCGTWILYDSTGAVESTVKQDLNCD